MLLERDETERGIGIEHLLETRKFVGDGLFFLATKLGLKVHSSVYLRLFLSSGSVGPLGFNLLYSNI